MATPKQKALNHYLAGCVYLNIEPDAEHLKWTRRILEEKTEQLRGRARAAKRAAIKTSISSNTANAKKVVTQAANESYKALQSRAKAVARKVGFTVKIERYKG